MQTLEHITNSFDSFYFFAYCVFFSSFIPRIALDSSGSPGSGFVLGHNFWLGSMKGCEAVQKPPRLTLSSRFQRVMHSALLTSTAPFDIGYRMVYAQHKSPWQIQVEFMLDKIVGVLFYLYRLFSIDHLSV